MKNYLARLGLPRKASKARINDAIEKALQDPSQTQIVLDAETILCKPATRAYYERTHLQYEAIHAALDCLGAPNAVDTHCWHERTVEFEPMLDDEPL